MELFFHYNCPVEGIIVKNNLATGVTVNGEFKAFDTIISGADYHHTEQILLDKEFRKYNTK